MTDEERALDVQTSKAPIVEKARREAIRDLETLVGTEGARTIAEAIGGPLGSFRGATQAIAKVIDRAMQAQRNRDRLMVLADEARQRSESNMRRAARAEDMFPEYDKAAEAGTYRGLAFKDAEEAALLLVWAKEVA